MTLPFPLFLSFGLFLLTLAAYLFRRMEKIVSGLAGLFTGLLALWLLGDAPTRDVVPILGRLVQVDMRAVVVRFDLSFHLAPTAVPILSLTLLLTAAVLLLNATAGQGRSFPPFALLLAWGYSLLLLLADAPLNPLLLTPAFLAVLTALSVYVLQAGRLGNTLGPLRSLLPPLIAFPLFVLASWHIDSLSINPQDAQAGAAAARFLALGLLLLLAPVPLHSAGPELAENAPPLAVAFLTLLYQLATLTLLLRMTSIFPFIGENSTLSIWLTGTGLLTAVWGGVAATGASHPGRLWGYALIHDWGLILLMSAVPGNSGSALVIFLFGLRILSTLAGAVGLANLRQAAGSLQPSWLRGIGRSLPWSTSAYVLGGLGLAGFPLSAGFTGHWAALQAVAQTDWRVAAVVLIASGGIVVGFVRLIRILYDPRSLTVNRTEPLYSTLIALAAILVVSGAALSPQTFTGVVSWVMMAFHG